MFAPVLKTCEYLGGGDRRRLLLVGDGLDSGPTTSTAVSSNLLLAEGQVFFGLSRTLRVKTVQVWSLTTFYSVSFLYSQPRIIAKV